MALGLGSWAPGSWSGPLRSASHLRPPRHLPNSRSDAMPSEGHSGLCLGPFALISGRKGAESALGSPQGPSRANQGAHVRRVSCPVKSKGSGRAPFTSHSHPPWALQALGSVSVDPTSLLTEHPPTPVPEQAGPFFDPHQIKQNHLSSPSFKCSKSSGVLRN